MAKKKKQIKIIKKDSNKEDYTFVNDSIITNIKNNESANGENKSEKKSDERIEKKRIEELRYNPPQDSVLLYQDEKGPIAAKTYGGPSWCSTQTKIEKAQKIYLRAWQSLWMSNGGSILVI